MVFGGMAEVQGKIPRALRDINGWHRYSSGDVEALGEVLFPSGKEANMH